MKESNICYAFELRRQETIYLEKSCNFMNDREKLNSTQVSSVMASNQRGVGGFLDKK